MTNIKNLPKGWELKKLGDIALYVNGRAFKPTEWKNDGKPIIRIQNLNKQSAPYNYSDVEHEAKYRVENGDLLFAWSASLGAYIWKGPEAWLNQHIFKVLPKDSTNKIYLYYLLEKLVAELYSQTHGSGMVHITKGKFEKTEVPFPSLQTQQAIVSKIEELFSELDKGIEDLKLAQEQLKVYKQSVLKYAFEGRLTNDNIKDGELPEGWKQTTLGAACEKIFDGTHFSPKNYPTGKYKYITAKNIKEKGIDLTKISYVSEEDHRAIYARSDVKKGDVLYIKDGATTGIACVNNFDEEFSLLSSVGVFRVDHTKVNPKFLSYFLNSQITRNRMLSDVAGVAITRLTLVKLKRAEFISIPISEQTLIVQEIESRLSVADKIIESIEENLQKAEALRQSILKKAFNGELVTEVKVIEIPKVKNEYFHQVQLVALVINGFKKKRIDHGEMTLAKNLYLLDSIYKIPTGFKYDRWHLGPYPPALKKVVNNKEYFKRNENFIETTNDEKLQKYSNPLQDDVNSAIADLSSIFSKYKGAERSHKTELLATVCKVIEDIKSTDLPAVRQSMKEWKIELATSKFKNKAEKFNESETEKCIGFIIERDWDRKLI